MSSEINPDFIEKYQNIYEKDPNSKVFAPLAEAYRRMGLHAQAIRVAERGVQVHPNFPSGRVTLAKVYIDTRNYEKATEHLKRATELSPENLLAFRLYAESLFKLRRAKEALDAYKMVLFLNPKDAKAVKVVKKLESLTADEFSADTFEMEESDFLSKKMESQNPKSSAADNFRGLERYISLIDAFIVRNDLERAKTAIERASEDFPSHPEIEQRRQILNERSSDVIIEDADELEPLKSRKEQVRERKLELLGNLLHRFQSLGQNS